MKKNLQRLLSGVVLAVLLAGLLPARATAAAPFTDVPAGHWAASEIGRAVELGLFRGETASTFGLGHRMTRAAFAVVLGRFFGWESISPETGSYTDNQDPAAWYYSAVETAFANGALTQQAETFRPGDAITRAEMAVMLIRALGYGTIAGLAQELPVPFTDLRTNSGYLSMAYELGLVGGTSATAFSPDRPATREQAAVILMRLYDKLHAQAPTRIGIAASAEDLTDLRGYGAVAVAAGKLVYAGRVQLSMPMAADTEAALIDAARTAGADALLYVTGGASALKSPAADTAAALAAAVSDGGYDGLFLDLAKLKDADRAGLTELVRALDAALGKRTLSVMAEAPVWQGDAYGGYDYAALGAAADRLVLRVAPYAKVTADFPTAPMEPLEEVYYALSELGGAVPAEKLSLLLTTTASVWSGGKPTGSVDASEVDRLLAAKGTEVYYSSRYACAYLTATVKKQETVLWYLDRESLAQRAQLAVFFGVGELCLSDLNSVSAALAQQPS